MATAFAFAEAAIVDGEDRKAFVMQLHDAWQGCRNAVTGAMQIGAPPACQLPPASPASATLQFVLAGCRR